MNIHETEFCDFEVKSISFKRYRSIRS